MNHRRQDPLWGYRPLITHNRKPNKIPATEQLENHSAHCTLPAEMPPSTQRPPSRRDEAAVFTAKVEALVERFKPFAARTRERNHKMDAIKGFGNALYRIIRRGDSLTNTISIERSSG